jgi:hypothetical protein
MAERKRPTHKEMLASMLIEWLHDVPLGKRAGMTADEVLAFFECHHMHPVALGGDNRPFNLKMLFKPEHRERTARVDIPAIAKVKRGLRKRAGQAKRKAQMPYTRAAATHKRKLSGEVVAR